MYTSKYAQAWRILKQLKILELTLENARVERTVRKGIIEHKKLDKDKNPLERIKVTKALNNDNKLVLTFTLVPIVRKQDDYFDL